MTWITVQPEDQYGIAVYCEEDGSEAIVKAFGDFWTFGCRYGFLWLRKRTLEQAIIKAILFAQDMRDLRCERIQRVKETEASVKATLNIAREL